MFSSELMTSLRQQRRLIALVGIVIFITVIWLVRKPWNLIEETRYNTQTSTLISKHVVNEYSSNTDIDQVRTLLS